MKVIVISSLGAGGAERVTALLANTWARTERVAVVTLGAVHEDRYALDAAVVRIGLDLNRDSRGAFDAVWSNFRRIARLRRVLFQLQPDAVLAMMPTANILLALAGAGMKCRRVGSERTYPPAAEMSRSWQLLRRICYRLLHGVVAQTEEGARWLRDNTSAGRVHVIPNPIVWPMPAGSPILDAAGIVPSGRSIVLAAGRLLPVKGFDLLLEAFARIADAHPDWDLVILGEGPMRSQLESTARLIGPGDRVRLPGHTGNPADFYARADIFALPSRREGFPNVLIEAMASGVPVVAFDCLTGPRAILSDGVDGLLVPAGDVAALAHALQRLITDPALRQRIGAHATGIRRRYSASVIVPMFDRLLGHAGSPAAVDRPAC